MSRLRSVVAALTVIVILAVVSAWALLQVTGASAPDDPAVAPATQGSIRIPKSLDDEVARTPLVFTGKVVDVGPVFNGWRAGDSMESGPSRDGYSLAQIYVVRVERYLKGAGPETVRTAQKEGELTASTTPTADKVKQAKAKYRATPMVVGSRYVFFLGNPAKIPELGNLEILPLFGSPSRYLLSSDGAVVPEAVPAESLADVVAAVKPGQEAAFVARIEKAVADQRK